MVVTVIHNFVICTQKMVHELCDIAGRSVLPERSDDRRAAMTPAEPTET